MTEDTWRIDVTDADIRTAKRAWIAARDDADVPDARVERLYDDLRALIHTQAQQLAEAVRARRSSRPPAAD
jgi:hypothetical protein